MNGKIDKCGGFQVERAGKMEGQRCPFSMDLGACGDWCPHFGEPAQGFRLASGDGGVSEFEETPHYTLSICHSKTFTFDEFTDERGTQ
jgi:hypothetical protein